MKRTELPEYKAYMEMLLLYKKKKSDYAIFLRQFKHFKDSENPMQRLRFYEEKSQHSEVCKAYYKARLIYQEAAARLGCEDKGIDLSAMDIAKIAGVSIPVSMRDIIETEKKQRIIDNTPPEALAELIRINKEIMQRRLTGESIEDIESSSTDVTTDPTFEDFSPL